MLESTRQPVGAPRKFKSPEQLQKLIDKYSDKCLSSKKPMTIVGLALALHIDTQTIYNYRDYSEEYSKIIKRAKLLCEDNLLNRMLMGDSPSSPSIFVLKNHYNYVDKQETVIHQTVSIAESLEERRLIAVERARLARTEINPTIECNVDPVIDIAETIE
jgi:cobalamin biosynthesis protein CobT